MIIINQTIQMKNTILFLSFLIGFPAHAQDEMIYLKGKLKVIGSYNNASDTNDIAGFKVLINKGKKQVVTLVEKRNFVFELERNSDYVVTFERKGYISKQLGFNTKNAPESFWNELQEPYEFIISLDKQPMNELVIYNQPVGVISYMKEIEGFSYTVNYAKTVKQKVVEKQDLKEK